MQNTIKIKQKSVWRYHISNLKNVVKFHIKRQNIAANGLIIMDRTGLKKMVFPKLKNVVLRQKIKLLIVVKI